MDRLKILSHVEYRPFGNVPPYHFYERGLTSFCSFLMRMDFRIDLSVVCDCFEEICSEIVISSHLRPPRGYTTLHDLVVPRRWIANSNKLATVKELSIYRFLRFARSLMDRLCSSRAWSASYVGVTDCESNFY